MSGKHSHRVTFWLDDQIVTVRLIVNPDDATSAQVSIRHNRTGVGWQQIDPADVEVVSGVLHTPQPWTQEESRSR